MVNISVCVWSQGTTCFFVSDSESQSFGDGCELVVEIRSQVTDLPLSQGSEGLYCKVSTRNYTRK